MARILNKEIPDHKRGVNALTVIYGIGLSTSAEVLTKLNINHETKPREWTTQQLKQINDILSSEEYTIEGERRKEVYGNIKRLKDMPNCYRGERHKKGLPVRGQKTKTNARTHKGKRKSVAGKNKVNKK